MNSACVLLLLLALPAAWAADPQVIVILGPPGSGQTTQAKALQQRLKLPVVSVEDMIRADVDPKSPEGKQVVSFLSTGSLQRLDMVNDLVSRRLAEPDVSEGFIMDGYPRTWKQAQVFEELLAKHKLPAVRMIVLDVSDAEALRRMRKRGSAVDKPGLMEERLEAFHKEIDAVTAHFAGRMVKVNGVQPSEQVTADILRALGR